MKALMIGAGGIASQHLNALKRLHVELTGIYDVDHARAAALAEKYGSVGVEDYLEAASRSDMVFLLTPPSTRLAYVKELSRLCKNLFVEKPLAVTVEDAMEMERIAEENGMICMVGFTQRFREGYRRIKALLDDGTLGDVVQAMTVRIGPGPGANGQLQESWRTDRKFVCGMTIESLSHDIDFVQALAGEITEVSGQVKGTIPVLEAFDNNSDAVFRFESGAIGSITCSWGSAIAYTMKGVIGSKGAAFLYGDDIWDNTKLVVRTLDGEQQVYELDDIFQAGEGYYNEDRYFIECIKENKNPECNLMTGRKVLQVSHRILNR